MTEEEKTEIVEAKKAPLKEAIIVTLLSMAAGLVAETLVQAGVSKWKARRETKTTVAAIEQ